PADTALAPMPPWLLALCQNTTRREAVDAGAPIPDHQRNDTLFRLGASMRAKGFQEAAIFAALWETNQSQCQPPLDEPEVHKIAHSVCRYEAGSRREDTKKRRNGDTPDIPEQAATTWLDKLLCNKNGTPQQTINNFVHTIRHLEPWRTAGYWYDVVRERHMIGTNAVEDSDATVAGVLIERATQIRVTNIALAGRALDYVCRKTARDLLQEWVQTLPVVPVTDLLTTWLRTYAHVPDIVSDAYVADVSRILPVGIIARILRPGSQYRYVPVL